VPGVQPGFISADASHVYFTSQSDGRALRQRHEVDMQPEELGGGPEAFAITVDGDGAYWTNRGLDCEAAAPSGGSVDGVPLAGGTSVALATGERCPEAIVSDGDYVYWTRNAGIDVASDDSIVRARKLR
jgi:hypothetical protein